MFKVAVGMNTVLETDDFVEAFRRFSDDVSEFARKANMGMVMSTCWIECSDDRFRAPLFLKDLFEIGTEFGLLKDGQLVEGVTEISADKINEIAQRKFPGKVFHHLNDLLSTMQKCS